MFFCSNIFVCLLYSSLKAQQVKDTVYLTSSDIKKMVDDKYYVRVPNSDLEQRLQDKVAAVVNDKFNFIYGLIGIASFLIGSILLFNLRNVVGARIDKELKETHMPLLNKKIDDHIKEIKERNDDMKEMLKTKFNDLDRDLNREIENYFLKNFKENMDAAVRELRQEQEKAFQAQAEFSQKSQEMMKVFNEMRFEKLRSNVDNRRDLQKTLDGFKDLLTQADKSNDSEMISRVLNELSYVTFYLKKDAEYEKLIDAYADRTDVEINEAAYVNAALGCLYDYQSTGENFEREKALRYLNNALRKTPDYGEALGLKLELFMTDYDNTLDTEKKAKAGKEAEKLIDFISSKNIAAYETTARFKRVQASTAKSNYIDLVYQVFPEKMKQMEKIAEDYKPAAAVK